MTEADWLACSDPRRMLRFLRGKARDRKFHLFAVAQCRRLSHWFDAPPNARDAAELKRLLDVGERAADGLAGRTELRAVSRSANRISGGGWDDFVGGAVGWGEEARQYFQHPEEWAVRTLATNCVPDGRTAGTQEWPEAAEYAVMVMVQLASVKAEDAGQSVEQAEQDARADQAAWVREIFGNPFRPFPPPPPAVLDWNGGTVRHMAGAIYQERAFDRLPVLADALLDAGCDNEELMRHCRGAGPHARGCWAVDLVLAKR